MFSCTLVCLSYNIAGVHFRHASHIVPYFHLSPLDLYFEPHPKSISISVVLPHSPVVNLSPRFSSVAVLREVSAWSWGICSSQVAIKTSLVFSSWPLQVQASCRQCSLHAGSLESLQGGLGFVCMDTTITAPALRSCHLPGAPFVDRPSCSLVLSSLPLINSLSSLPPPAPVKSFPVWKKHSPPLPSLGHLFIPLPALGCPRGTLRV